MSPSRGALAAVPTSAAAQGATYIIQGQRGTLTGTPCDALTIQFGTDGLGSFNISGVNTALRIAA